MKEKILNKVSTLLSLKTLPGVALLLAAGPAALIANIHFKYVKVGG